LRKTIGLISTPSVGDMKGLTKHRSVDTLPFGARYRLIDFAMSNFVNSGLKKVGILASNKYRSLIDHVGTGQEWSLSRKSQELIILQGNGTSFRKNHVQHISMEDLHDNDTVFLRNSFDDAIISASNVVCNFKFDEALCEHRRKDADVTLICKKARHTNEASQNCLKVKTNESNEATEFSYGQSFDFECIYLEMLLIKYDVLLRLIEEAAERRVYDLIEMIISKHSVLNVQVFDFKGYYRRIDSIESYYQASMEILNPNVLSRLFLPDQIIYTKTKDNHPTQYGKNAQTRNSLIASGCEIEGKVDNCIIFRQNQIGKNTVVNHSIIMEGSTIGDNVMLEYVILDKAVTISNDVVLQGTREKPVVLYKNADI